MGKRVLIASVLGIVFMLIPSTAHSAEADKNGLYISPVRQELTVSQGKVTYGSVEIANYTGTARTVNLSVREFSVADYSYDYKFHQTKNNWIKIEKPSLILQSGQKERIKFALDAPINLRPGGHYFALFASSDMSTNNFKQTAQVVSTLFISAEGKFIRSGTIKNGTVPFVNLGNKISYQFDASNTGNVHYSAFMYGQLESLVGKLPEAGASHVLMPGTTRTIGGSVAAPLLPGIYKMTFGFKTNAKPGVSSKTAYVLFIPPWSIVVLVVLVVGAWKIWGTRSRGIKKDSDR